MPQLKFEKNDFMAWDKDKNIKRMSKKVQFEHLICHTGRAAAMNNFWRYQNDILQK